MDWPLRNSPVGAQPTARPSGGTDRSGDTHRLGELLVDLGESDIGGRFLLGLHDFLGLGRERRGCWFPRPWWTSRSRRVALGWWRKRPLVWSGRRGRSGRLPGAFDGVVALQGGRARGAVGQEFFQAVGKLVGLVGRGARLGRCRRRRARWRGGRGRLGWRDGVDQFDRNRCSWRVLLWNGLPQILFRPDSAGTLAENFTESKFWAKKSPSSRCGTKGQSSKAES